MMHMDGQSPSAFTDSTYTGMAEFNTENSQDNNNDQNDHPDTANDDSDVSDEVVDYSQIPMQTYLTELKLSFKAIRASRDYGFEGLDFPLATTVIKESLGRYGKSSFISVRDIENIVESCDKDGDNKLFKTEFLVCGKQVAE